MIRPTLLRTALALGPALLLSYPLLAQTLESPAASHSTSEGFKETASPARPLSLAAAIESALARNFDLRINRQAPVIAQGQLDSARGAYIPTVSVGVERQHVETPAASSGGATTTDSTVTTAGVSGLLSTGATYSISGNLSGSSVKPAAFSSYESSQGTLAILELTQPLLKNRRIDGARLTLGQSKLALRSAELTAFQQAMTTVSAVEQAYFDLLASHETVRVNESALQLAEQSLADTRRRIALGSLPPLDARDAQSLVASSHADLLSARQTLRERENALLLLITDAFADWRQAGLAPTDTLGEDEVATDYGQSVGFALANRPEIERFELALDQLDLGVAYREDQRKPEVNLTGSVGLQGADSRDRGVLSQWRDGDNPYYTVGVTVSFPWSDRGRRGDLRAARGQAEQARLQLAQQREIILGEVDSAIAAVRTHSARITATREARIYADAALAAEKGRLASGSSTTFAVLQLQRNLVAAQADAIQAVADYNKSLSVLRLREGSTLEFWRIRLSTTHAPATAAPARS